MKRIISLILTMILLMQVSLIPTEAASKNRDFEKSILSTLEIIPKSVKDTDTLTRYELAEVLSKIACYKNKIVLGSGETMYVDVPHTADVALIINTVTARGIMSGIGEGKFAPDQNVSLNQAVAAVVNLLGYSKVALGEGGFPKGYLKTASDIGIMKGVNSSEEILNYANLKTLLANALDTDVMIKTGVGENQKYEIYDKTLLQYEMGLKTVEGIVLGSKLSAVTEEAFTGEGEINIGGVKYAADGFNPASYVGYFVNACIEDDDEQDPQKVVFIELVEKKNKTLEISSEEFKSYDDDRITYLPEGTSKKSKANIAEGADVMHNGTPLTRYTEDDFVLTDGIITLIDNDGDGDYEIISLTEQKTTIVKNVNISKKTIMDMFVAENTLNMNNADDEQVHCFNVKGKSIKLGDIEIGDVVTWYVDRTGENYTLIVANDTAISGSIEKVDKEDGAVIIDEEEYKIAPSYKARYADEIKFGRSGTFYLDYKGRIVGFSDGKGVENQWNYGWFVKAVYSDEQDAYLMKIHAEDDTEKYYTVAEKAKLDFEKIVEPSDESITHPLIDLPQQLIKFMMNSDGEISKIDTIEADDEENSLRQIFSGSEAYKGMGTDSFNGKLIVNSKTKTFLVPQDGARGDIEVVSGYFETDKTYTITAYGTEDSKIADVIVVRKGATESTTEGVAFLTEIIVTTNSDEEVRYKLTLKELDNLGSKVTLWGSENLDPSSVKRGQIISYRQNTSEEVVSVSSKYDPKTGEVGAFTAVGSGIGATDRVVFAKAGRIEDNKYLTLIAEEQNSLKGDYEYEIQTLSVYGGMIYKYDESAADLIVPASASDIIDFESAGNSCSRIVNMTSLFWPRGIIIFNTDN